MVKLKYITITLATILIFLTITSVSALASSTFSLRSSGDESNIDQIDIYNHLTSARVRFSAFHSDIKDSGKGSLTLTGKASNGDRISLNLKLTELEVIENSGDKIIVKSEARGRYYSTGLSIRDISYSDIIYEYDYSESVLSVYSENGDIPFEITNLETRPSLRY